MPESVDQAITTTAAEPLWRRAVMVLARAQPGGNPSGLIYGMIVASVVITAQLHYDVGLTRVVTVTSLTVIVYWLTHVYCHLLGHAVAGEDERVPWASLLPTLRSESTVLWGGAIELAAVATAYALGADLNDGDWITIGVTIVLLFCWGLIVGVSNHARTRHVMVDALLGASLGALVALLKFLIK